MMDPEVNFRRTSTIGAEEDPESSECPEQTRECCPPQLFTSILLGLLACVLVTGGVFLAFHKWDHTWLLVSAVGVLLMAIGTAMHCCSNAQSQRTGHRCKNGCSSGTRCKPDSVGHGTSTILTEQLLPLSNARSVSQLSLNMVPGYFPPLVYPTGSPYGLEQHSAVVQNISKLVQHHQQLHLQSPSAAQSDSKSFILLPLPADANIQNIVAAVCQLDANNADSSNDAQTTDVSSQATETSVLSRENAVPSAAQQPSTSCQPVLKHAEVQTSCDWARQPANELKPSNGLSSVNIPTNVEPSTTSLVSHTANVPLQRTAGAVVAVSIAVETVPPEETVLQIEDTNCDNENLLLSDVPAQLETLPDPPLEPLQPTIIRPQPVEENPVNPSSEETQIAPDASEGGANSANSTDDTSSSNIPAATPLEEASSNNIPAASPLEEASSNNIPVASPLEEASSSSENLADISSDLESELFDRSSPPPSYEDVTQSAPNNSSLNGFGLAYGTM